MSGHSKWNNIKRKKEKTDGARAKVFTKIGREISVAVRDGGPNPASNSKLADLIAKAKRMSVPNDNIQRIIKKAEGGDKTEYEAITYEGYGPGGVAVMVEYLTVISVLFVLLGFLMIFRYTLQGLGYSVQAVISGVGELIGRALGGWLAVHQLGYLGICISNPLAWGFALCYCVFMVTRVLKKESRAA